MVDQGPLPRQSPAPHEGRHLENNIHHRGDRVATIAGAQEGKAPAVTDAPPQSETGAPGYPAKGEQFAINQAPACRKISKGGPIAGIVVASVFWFVLPMSIPVWITQAKELKRRKAEIYEQQQRGCP